MSISKQVNENTYDRRLDIQNLRRIMSYGRPASSEMEKFWVNEFLFTPEMQAAGMYKDGFHYPRQAGEGEGNLIIKVGDGGKTLFSSHTDTVHRTGVIQNVIIDPTQEKLKFTTDSGQCLGGDDGTGVWLMLELIKAGVPGLYIFHRAEEVGGQGSSYIANQTPELVEGYERAIAFDRKDDWSVITHQAGTRTCSDDFAEELVKKLGMNHRTDTTGSFTDTANYDTLIPECTNLSVGYHNAHSARENQEIDYLLNFRDALINVDWESLVTKRDPSVPEYSTYGYYGYGDKLVKPQKKVREAMNWGDYEDQQFEKNRAKEFEEKEKTSNKIESPKESIIVIEEEDKFIDVLAFLEKPSNSMTDEEFNLSEMLENGVISYDELEAMLSYDDTVYEGNYQVSEELNILEENPKGLDDFLDDYPIKGSKKNKKDFADYEDDDFDWELWFKSQ
tara:strand:- start:13082 stop:14425 length:1344 start_codon:yes stop_codon:yes gene_type:complete